MKKSTTEGSHTYRFYGDNFLVFLNQEDELELLKKNLQELLERNKINFKLKTTQLGQEKMNAIESLEDVLQKLF